MAGVNPISVDELYGDCGITDEALHAKLDRSLDPRGPSMLFDAIEALGLSSGHEVLDLGCRNARYACELVARFRCRALGIDPVGHHVEQARHLVAERQLANAVVVAMGSAEAIPCTDASIDFIWCRDVLNHVQRLDAAFRECARVMRPSGRMLVFQTFATELLEP